MFCFFFGGGGVIRPPDSGVSFLQNPCRFSHKMPKKHGQQFPLILQLSFQLHKELVHYHTILQQLTRLCPRDLIPQTPPPILLLHKTVSAGCSEKKIIFKKKSTATCGQHYETKSCTSYHQIRYITSWVCGGMGVVFVLLLFFSTIKAFPPQPLTSVGSLRG